MMFQKIIAYFKRLIYLYSMEEKDIIGLKESGSVELKRASDRLPLSFWETYSSFANTDGGTIYLGIEERKGAGNLVVGVKNVEEMRRAIISTANNPSKVSCNLLSNESFSTIDINGKAVLAVSIPAAKRGQRPVYLDANPFLSYKRVGDADQLLSKIEAISMLSDSSMGSFDLGSSGLTKDCLSQRSCESYRERYRLAHPDHPLTRVGDEEFFKAVGAMREEDGKEVLTNAGLLCFGCRESIKRIYPSYSLDFQIKDEGEAKWRHRLSSDDLSFSGNIYDFFEGTMSALRPLLPSPYYLSGDSDLGPAKVYLAVQEAILNALFNADYLLPNSVRVVFEYKRISIENSGKLRIPLPLAIKGGHSDPRNAGVAQIFRSVGLGDKAGSGIPTMFLNLKEVGNLAPIYTQSSEPISTTITINFGKALGKESEEILAYLASHQEGASSSELCGYLGLSRYKVGECLEALSSNGLIKDNGKSTKGKIYFLA